MTYYDEEPMYEQVPEFLEKIQEIVGEAVVTGRAEMVRQIESLQGKNNELTKVNREQKNSLYNVQYEIKKQVEAARKEFEREIFGGFLRGDPMFYTGFEYESTPCETCNGVGMLLATLGDGNEVKVKCFGEKCESGKIKKGVYVVRETRVKRFYLSMDDYGKKDVRIYFKQVGGYSESDLRLSDCYKSAEEAQKVCNEKTVKHRKEQEEREERERRNKKQ